MALLEVADLSFSYSVEGRRVPILKDVSFAIQKGDFVAIQGPSGSGKSTLFYILGCLLRTATGKIFFAGQDVSQMSNEELALFRNRKIGFVFQQFHLLARANVLDNILLPTRYPCEVSSETAQMTDKARKLADRLGLSRHLHYFPNQLSGGQQQRVAIARALMNDVEMILADEPTGNLDSRNAAEIMELLRELNRQGKTIVLITHDPEIARQCGKTFQIRDGVLTAPPENRLTALSGAGKGSAISSKVLEKNNFQEMIAVARSVAPLSLSNLRRNKGRSALTMLGITIGIAAVISMVTFGQFTKKKILQSYESLGVNKVTLWAYKNDNRKASDRVQKNFENLDWTNDIEPLRIIFPEIRYMSPTFNAWNKAVSYAGRSVSDESMVWGVNAEDQAISNRELIAGRAFTPYHIANFSPVCLIGTELVEKLFLKASPLGQILFIGGNGSTPYPCQVIGVIKKRVSNKDWYKPNREVVLPFTYFKNVSDFWEGRLHNVAIQVRAGTDMEKFTRGMKAYFKHKYGSSGEFGVDSDSILIAQMKKFLTLFTIMISSIALITLGVGGIGINNMMLVSVNERLKEIGLLKAIGATDKSIRFQFLLESIALCAAAGLLGILIGFSGYETIIFVAAKFVPQISFEWLVDPVAVLVSVFAILFVGIASGITPAIKAEKLEVIEALRSE